MTYKQIASYDNFLLANMTLGLLQENNVNCYLKDENITSTDFESYVEGTQELQSRAVQTAIEAHLKAKPFCMGSLVWQWNDCWPAVSWSIIDYYGNKKKAYYTMKKLYIN